MGEKTKEKIKSNKTSTIRKCESVIWFIAFFIPVFCFFYESEVTAAEASMTVSYPGSDIDYGYTFYDGFWYQSYEEYKKETLYHEDSSCYYCGSHAYGD